MNFDLVVDWLKINITNHFSTHRSIRSSAKTPFEGCSQSFTTVIDNKDSPFLDNMIGHFWLEHKDLPKHSNN